MNILFKHTFSSLTRDPMQSVIVVISAAMITACVLLCLTITSIFEINASLWANYSYGGADMLVVLPHDVPSGEVEADDRARVDLLAGKLRLAQSEVSGITGVTVTDADVRPAAEVYMQYMAALKQLKRVPLNERIDAAISRVKIDKNQEVK